MGNQVIKADEASVSLARPMTFGEMTREQVELLKDTLCKGASDSELKLFIEVCRSKRLDPFARQIHAVKRWDRTLKRDVMSYQTGIDGFRLMAERTGNYAGQDGPHWCGADGVWRDVWLSEKPPVAARVGVHRSGFASPVYAVALYREYVQTGQDGRVNSMWAKMPANQLAKCAEALALRKAFPEQLGGLYTNEEMGQADAVAAVDAVATGDARTTRTTRTADAVVVDARAEVVAEGREAWSDDKFFRDACVAAYRMIGDTAVFNGAMAEFGGVKPAEIPVERRRACYERLTEIARQMNALNESEAA